MLTLLLAEVVYLLLLTPYSLNGNAVLVAGVIIILVLVYSYCSRGCYIYFNDVYFYLDFYCWCFYGYYKSEEDLP